MEDVKRLGFPLLIIVLSAFLSRLLETYLHGSFVHTLMVILIVSALFLFGVSLNKSRKKRSNAVFKKSCGNPCGDFDAFYAIGVFYFANYAKCIHFDWN